MDTGIIPHDPAWWAAWSRAIKDAPVWEDGPALGAARDRVMINLRQAAALLPFALAEAETMAGAGTIPGMLVRKDGTRRFSKPTLVRWILAEFPAWGPGPEVPRPAVT